MNWIFIRVVDTYLGIPLLLVMGFFRMLLRKRKPAPALTAHPRVLFVKFWGIGNIFMLLPAVAALRLRHSPSRIDLLTLESNRDAAGVIGAFDTVYTIDTANAGRFLRTTASNARALRGNRYDLVVDFEQFARFSALLCRFIAGTTSIGFATKGQHRHALYTRSHPYDNTIHIRHSFLSLIPPAPPGADRQSASDAGHTRPGSDAAIRREAGAGEQDILLVMHIGTSDNFQERRWPMERYVELAERLIDRFGVRVAFTGLSGEALQFAHFLNAMQHRERAADLTGKLDFHRFYRLIAASDLVVSADTAAVHIASYTGIPVVALYGPNTPLLYGPWGPNSWALYKSLSCSPCITNFNAKIHTCKHPDGKGACMAQISVEEAYSCIARRYFDRNAPFRWKIIAPETPCAAF